MSSPREEKLRLEVTNMFQYVERLRAEIATISNQGDDPTHFSGMTVQLDAIVEATDNATHRILEATEVVEDIAAKIRDETDPKAREALCDQLSEQTMQVMEACSFQDITGQRIAKVMGSLKFVAEHIGSMVELWGRDEIETLVQDITKEKEQAEEASEEVALEGPALPGEAISQDDIDALFD